METKRTLKPGQPGTLKYVQKYGDSLVCIRYRYDADKNLCYTTAELIVETRTWLQKSKNTSVPLSDEKSTDQIVKSDHEDTLLSIRIGYEELELRELVTSAGGKWNRQKKSGKFHQKK